MSFKLEGCAPRKTVLLGQHINTANWGRAASGFRHPPPEKRQAALPRLQVEPREHSAGQAGSPLPTGFTPWPHSETPGGAFHEPGTLSITRETPQRAGPLLRPPVAASEPVSPPRSFLTQLSQPSPLLHLNSNCPFLSPQLPLALPSPTAAPFPAPLNSPSYPLTAAPSFRTSRLSRAFLPSSLCPRHTPHDADPLLPRPTDRPLQLTSCPAWPSRARACTRHHGNRSGRGRAAGARARELGLLGAGAVKSGHQAPCPAGPVSPRRGPGATGLGGKGKLPDLAGWRVAGGLVGTQAGRPGAGNNEQPPAGHQTGWGNLSARPRAGVCGLHPGRVQQMAPGVPPARLTRALEGAPGFRGSRGCS